MSQARRRGRAVAAAFILASSAALAVPLLIKLAGRHLSLVTPAFVFCPAPLKHGTSNGHAGRKAAITGQHLEQSLEDRLTEAAASLASLRSEWGSMAVNDAGTATRQADLLSRESSIRASFQNCEYGNPADIYVVPQQDCKDSMVRAYGRAAKAVVELELAQREWEVRQAEVSGQPPETAAFVGRILSMAVLRIRLFQFEAAYELVQRAAVFFTTQPFTGGEADAARNWYRNLCREIAMSQVLREPGSMSGIDLSPGSTGEGVLRDLHGVFMKHGYTKTSVLTVAQVSTIEVFVKDDIVEEVDARLVQLVQRPNPDQRFPSRALIDLVRIFLLSRVVPLKQLRELVGSELCQLLLRLQAVTGVVGESLKLLGSEHVASLVASNSPALNEIFCFANIKVWPVEEDVLIATDRQTWPCKNFEPVLYMSDDSLALVSAAPRRSVQSVLDLCTGSGVQGIVALRHYADSATFVDLNPRALDFVRFNLALNGFAGKAAGIHLGDLYKALPSSAGPYGAILANPPFLPNPGGIASQNDALFGGRGLEFGEEILERIVQGAPAMLTQDGVLSAVTFAPNVNDMPARIERYFSSGSPTAGCAIAVHSGAQEPAAQFNPVSNEVEAKRYQEVLRDLSISTMAPAITICRLDAAGAMRAELFDQGGQLFQDHSYLQSVSRQVTAEFSQAHTGEDEPQ